MVSRSLCQSEGLYPPLYVPTATTSSTRIIYVNHIGRQEMRRITDTPFMSNYIAYCMNPISFGSISPIECTLLCHTLPLVSNYRRHRFNRSVPTLPRIDTLLIAPCPSKPLHRQHCLGWECHVEHHIRCINMTRCIDCYLLSS